MVEDLVELGSLGVSGGAGHDNDSGKGSSADGSHSARPRGNTREGRSWNCLAVSGLTPRVDQELLDEADKPTGP